MPIYLNNNKVKDLYVGNTKIGWSFLNGKLVYTNQIKTFNAGSNLVQYKVPNGVNKLHVDCIASKGMDNAGGAGLGGRVQCDLNVSGGQILYITVGEIPTDQQIARYNASDVRLNGTSLNDRIIVAGGGGSGSSSYSNDTLGPGGNGGGLTGGNGRGSACNGTGGTQTAGGSPGSGRGVTASDGTFGLGGIGGSGNYSAGGAGWYGGGGGSHSYSGKNGWFGGGGGGSSYTHPTLCSNVVHTQGYMNGNGYIKITPIN